MTIPVGIDTSVVLDAVKTAIANGRPNDAIRNLNALIPSQGMVTNRILIEEYLFEPGLSHPHYDQIMSERNLIKQWLDQGIANGKITVHELTPAEMALYKKPDGTFIAGAGEKSFIEKTLTDPRYAAPDGDFLFYTSDDITNKPFFDPANKSKLSDLNDFFSREAERAKAEGRVSDYEDMRQRAVDLDEGARKAPNSDGSPRSVRNPGIDRPTDVSREIPHDIDGKLKIGDTIEHFDELSAALRKALLRGAAGEAVGTALILVDSYETRQKIVEALARGDVRSADVEMGGLIGRAFGGAFGGALLGAELGSALGPGGAIAGAILGGIIGGVGGGELRTAASPATRPSSSSARRPSAGSPVSFALPPTEPTRGSRPTRTATAPPISRSCSEALPSRRRRTSSSRGRPLRPFSTPPPLSRSDEPRLHPARRRGDLRGRLPPHSGGRARAAAGGRPASRRRSGGGGSARGR